MPRKAKLKEPPLWWPMFALPNVHTTFPIEVDGFGLVPPDDFRIQAIAREQRRFGSFMNKFKTEFGDPVQPSTIIWRRDKPGTYRTISAISGFRDLISMSVIPIAWARSHRWGRSMGAMYSDAFAVYPWMVDNRGEGLITSTPNMRGYHEVKRLHSQTMPALSPHTLNKRDVDLLLWANCSSGGNVASRPKRRQLGMSGCFAHSTWQTRQQSCQPEPTRTFTTHYGQQRCGQVHLKSYARPRTKPTRASMLTLPTSPGISPRATKRNMPSTVSRPTPCIPCPCGSLERLPA
jgi:hypothetical protein